MTLSRSPAPFGLAGFALLASAASPVLAREEQMPIPSTPGIVLAQDPTAAPPASPKPVDRTVSTTIVPGTETAPVIPSAPAIKPPRRGDISLNLPGADLAVVAQAVLGDILRRPYTIAQGTTGTVTLVTPYPVAKSSLLDLFEEALRKSGFGLVRVAGGFEIQPVARARALVSPDAVGFGSEIVSLRFVNPDEVRKLLDTVLPGVVIATDPASGAMTIAGTTGQRASARDLLRQFDVDWLRNTSFALFVPRRTDARLIAPALDKLINAADSPTRGLVRLLPMEQLNGILAISTQSQYLLDIRRWVEILDREGESNERRIFVYRVQNGRARDLMRTINAAFGTGSGSGNGSDATAAGGGEQGAGNAPPSGLASAPPPRPSATGSASATGAPPAATRVTADEINNAVIVYGNLREYAVIEDALRKLDIAPQQVLIEAAITEVTLNDDMRYGVQWNWINGRSSFAYGEGADSTPQQIFPGFNYTYLGNNITASLNALQKHTNIKIVSAPKLMVLNNQTAALQVGDQVPVSTGSATNLNGGNAVVNTIEYRDTGVILKITPRVNASGFVQLDVSQEVSSVSTAAASASTQQQSPTISTRRIATTVSVEDGQVVALGGLFSNSRTFGKNGVPFLSRIPVLGAAFGTHTDGERRTELIVLLKPHVLANPDDARAVTEELRTKLRTVEPFRSRGTIP